MAVQQPDGLPVLDRAPVGWHPAVDAFDERYVVFATSSPTVRFTEPFASFLAEAVVRQVRAVLVTTTTAQVSSFVSLAMRRAAGVWAVQARDGAMYDALSGDRVDDLTDLWDRPEAGPSPAGPVVGGGARSEERAWLPGFADPPVAPQQVVMLDVQTHQAVDRCRVGAVAESLGAALGTSWQCWATREPLLEAWDLVAVTEAVRRAMPRSPTVRVVGADGAFCEVDVSRTSTGLAEHTVVGAPVADGTDLLAVATEAVERLVAEHNPVVGLVSVADYDRADGGVVHRPRARVPESPLAALIGPRAVRDLGLDVEHGARVLGRRRLPCLLVPFDEVDPVRRWRQAAAFVATLGRPELRTGGPGGAD